MVVNVGIWWQMVVNFSIERIMKKLVVLVNNVNTVNKKDVLHIYVIVFKYFVHSKANYL